MRYAAARADSGRQSCREAAAQKQQGGGFGDSCRWTNTEDGGSAAGISTGDVVDGQRVCAGTEFDHEPTIRRISKRTADVVETIAVVCGQGGQTHRHEVVEQLERVARQEEVENRYGCRAGERPRRRERVGCERIRRRDASSETTLCGAAGIELEFQPGAVDGDGRGRCGSGGKED